MKESFLKSVSGETLVFGLEWLPLIESVGVREARRRARHYRATHFVLASDKAGAVGLANIQRGRVPGTNKTMAFSAAQILAVLYQSGTWGMCLNLEPDCWWLVAIHEGVVVMRTDILAASPASFDSVISELRRAYPAMSYLQSGRDNSAPTLGDLVQRAGPTSMLQERRRGWTRAWAWMFAVAAVTVSGCVIFAIESGSGKTPDSVPTATTQQLDGRWRAAQQEALNKVVVHGVQGTQRLLDALYAVAVSPAGWRLTQVECRPGPRTWDCAAQFSRRHHATDNQALESALPASWKLHAINLDQAQATWSVPYVGLTLAQVQMPTETQNNKTWLGILQRSSIAFDRITWGEARPLAVTAPADLQGRSLPRPKGLAAYQARSLQVSGPLRSYVLLLADFHAIRWYRARLSLKDKLTPGVRTSQLGLLLEGEFHERIE
ncbi:MAG TPA: hypothetical protein DIS96_05575 [Pusillimonas sp.]|nr:hypothetical protein [Pusillimonas sp.]